MNKPIFVIPHYIITKELKQLSINAIKSMRQTADVFIVSCDDGSPMDTSYLEEISDQVVRSKRNLGFGPICNRGLEWAIKQDSDFIGCANNDIEVYPGWLEALIEPFNKWERVGMTGLVGTKDRERTKNHRGNKITEGGLLDENMQSGGLWLSRKSVLQQVGLFDEQFEKGGEEDVDLFLRVRDRHGYHIMMSDKSIFWHKEGATRWNEEIPGYKEENKFIEQENYDRFAKKWGFDIRQTGLNFYEDVLEQ